MGKWELHIAQLKEAYHQKMANKKAMEAAAAQEQEQVPQVEA